MSDENILHRNCIQMVGVSPDGVTEFSFSTIGPDLSATLNIFRRVTDTIEGVGRLTPIQKLELANRSREKTDG